MKITEIMARAHYNNVHKHPQRTWQEKSLRSKAADLSDMNAAIRALEEAGFQIVPKEPSDGMKWAKGAMNVWHATKCPECESLTSHGTSANGRADVYKAMLEQAKKDME